MTWSTQIRLYVVGDIGLEPIHRACEAKTAADRHQTTKPPLELRLYVSLAMLGSLPFAR